MKVLLFLWKYKILKDPANLSYQTRNFMKLSKKDRRKILDKYFLKFKSVKLLENYFDRKESKYYEEGREITFFDCYYFDKKLLEYNIKNIRFIDKFMIEPQMKEHLIKYVLKVIKEKSQEMTSKDLRNYLDNLPKALSENLDFMNYLVSIDESNIKYITYNEIYPMKQKELIIKGIQMARTKEFNLKKFLKMDGTLPKILETNFDFLIYLIENDISNIIYLDEKILENTTISNRRILVQTIITSLDKNPSYLTKIENIPKLSIILNSNEEFITYIIKLNLDNIRYIDWHNLNDTKRKNLINYITKTIEERNIDFDIMKYPFHQLFFENYNFMKYLIKKDLRWIAITKVSNIEENNKLINLFFEIKNNKKYKLRLEDFLEDKEHINHHLIENEKMLHYFFINKVPVVKYIDFFQLNSSKKIVENILKEISAKDYEFNNVDFLINSKYPIPLSNSYRFMRYVIDKNFNNLAYIDISMIDKHELIRIINYAFRMVYYIRGGNKNLNFDIDGYFKGTDILENEYFKECLKSL